MKRAVIAATALVLVFACCITAFADYTVDIKIDGKIDGIEWSKGKEYTLYEGNDSNLTAQFRVRCYFEGNNTVYYLFTAIEKKLADPSRLGFKIKLDDAPEFSVNTVENTFSYTDNDNITIEADFGTASSNASEQAAREYTLICEVRVNYKNGTKKYVSGKAQAYDSTGEASDTKPFSFENTELSTVTEADDTSKTKKETTTKRRVRDRETSSKKPISTSRVSTTKRETTTRKPTTTEKVTTAKTTTAKTTKAKTTKAKRTASKTTKAAGTSVVTSIVYVVPETVISGTVYVTEETEQETEKSAFGIKDMQKSTLMKIAAGAAALVLLGAIGVMAVKSKKDGDKDENTGKNNEE